MASGFWWTRSRVRRGTDHADRLGRVLLREGSLRVRERERRTEYIDEASVEEGHVRGLVLKGLALKR